MNKIYRVVWNVATGAWSAVAETAKARTKRAGRVAGVVAAVVAVSVATMGTAAASSPCKTAEGKDGTVDANGVCTMAALPPQGAGPSAGLTANVDDKYIKIETLGAAAKAGGDGIAIG